VVLVSGWLMLTRYGEQTNPSYAEPTRATLVSLGATDACELRAPGSYGEEEVQATNVYLYRPESEAADPNLMEVKYPASLAGSVRFEMDSSNGYGGSGPLEWVGERRSAKLGLGITDVIVDGRPRAILYVENGNQVLMGDCRTASQLRA
jgi:hypothetical protein